MCTYITCFTANLPWFPECVLSQVQVCAPKKAHVSFQKDADHWPTTQKHISYIIIPISCPSSCTPATKQPSTMRHHLLFLLPHLTLTLANDQERSIQIFNQSGRRVDVHWVPPYEGEMVLQSKPDILNGASLALNSYITHTFEVRELPGKTSGVCSGEGGVCQVDHFTVNSHENQVIFIRPGIEIEHSDTKTIAEKSAAKLLDECRSAAKASLAEKPGEAAEILNQLSACVESGIAKEIETANEEIGFQKEIRLEMSELLEDYTCYDEKMVTSEPKKSVVWNGRKVDIMLDRPRAKIHVIDNFITQQECDAVQEEAKDSLHDATVADGAGGSELDDSRRAKQAGIEVDWESEDDGDHLIAQVSRRVYDYTNHVLPFEINEDGQEDLMSIQYFGRGEDDEKPDRYMPHCDGDCDGYAFKEGERVATVVMYCDVPEVSSLY